MDELDQKQQMTLNGVNMNIDKLNTFFQKMETEFNKLNEKSNEELSRIDYVLKRYFDVILTLQNRIDNVREYCDSEDKIILFLEKLFSFDFNFYIHIINMDETELTKINGFSDEDDLEDYIEIQCQNIRKYHKKIIHELSMVCKLDKE
jgi:hypothetical protein